jgi:hypothetical protein
MRKIKNYGTGTGRITRNGKNTEKNFIEIYTKKGQIW